MKRTLMKGAYLLDPDLPLNKQDILIENDTIKGLSPNIIDEADIVIDVSDKIVSPGFISSHTHTFNTPLRGLQNLPLYPWLILIRHVYEKLGRDPRDLYLWNAIGATGLLKSGVTSLLEHGPYISPIGYESEVAATVKAFTDVGIRAVVCPGYRDVKFADCFPLYLLNNITKEEIALLDVFPLMDADTLLGVLRSLLQNYALSQDRPVSLGLGPIHAYRSSRKVIEGTVQLAGEFNVNVHSHLLETQLELIESKKVLSKSAVQFLAEIGCLGPGFSFAHGVWLDDEDILTLVETKSSIVHNPVSNLKLGSGIAPLQKMREQGLNVALGIDGTGGSNDSVNMFETMKYGAITHNFYGTSRNWISAEDAFRMCLTGGAKVLRKKIGSIRPGYKADLVVLRTDRLFMMPKENLINQLVFCDMGESIDKVIVGGQVVVENNEIKTVNENEVYREARESIQRVYASIKSLNEKASPILKLLEKMTTLGENYESVNSSLLRRNSSLSHSSGGRIG